MYEPDAINGADLDRFITGNYGEDEDIFDPDEDEELGAMPPAWCPECGADLTETSAVRIVEERGATRLGHAEPDGYYQDRATKIVYDTLSVECVACGYPLPTMNEG